MSLLKTNKNVISIFLFGLLTLPLIANAANPGQYDQLVTLFQDFREMTGSSGGDEYGSLPLVSPQQINAQKLALEKFQFRFAAIEPLGWSVSEQVDYHLVRAELNGLEFRHAVTRPWFRDPGTYSDIVFFLGEVVEFPLQGDRLAKVREILESIPEIFVQAQRNLSDVKQVPGDLALLAIRDLRAAETVFKALKKEFSANNTEMLGLTQAASQANLEFLGWLEANQAKMTLSAGIGKDQYNWLLKNVYLFPYTWDEVRTIVELEDNRVISFQRLEENRNRNIPPIRAVKSQAEYKQSVASAIEDLMNFIKEEQIFSMPDYLTADGYFGSWHGFENPWPEKHDYFFNFSHREPRMEEAHEMLGHHFDQLRAEHNPNSIRNGWRPYKIGTARAEGFAFALEELLMHAGYLDGRSPRAREIVYEQAAFRTVRALSDIYMHSKQWSLREAMAFSVANAPHGELLDNSPHLWYEMATTLRGVGHHMLMIVGKVQFMKLMRDRSQQLGDNFKLQEFMDEFLDSGMVPISLIRWEMTGNDDELKKLLQ